VGFDGVEADIVPRVFHESIEQDKGKEFTFEKFKSLPPMDVEDAEVSFFHMIFNLKGVLVGKDYFIINHFLLPLFNLA
jgi:hypothetical protein